MRLKKKTLRIQHVGGKKMPVKRNSRTRAMWQTKRITDLYWSKKIEGFKNESSINKFK